MSWWVDLFSTGARVGRRMERSFLLLEKENWRLGLNVGEIVCGSVGGWRRLWHAFDFFQ